MIWANIGRLLQFRHEFEQAADKFETAIQQPRAYPPARLGLAVALAQAGNREPALEMMDAARGKLRRPLPLLEGLRGYVLGLMGRTSKALEVAGELEALYLSHPGNARTGDQPSAPTLEETEVPPPYVSAEVVAAVYLGLEDFDAALQWLELAEENRSQIISFLGIEPMFDPLRSMPRFQALGSQVRFRSRGAGSPEK
jgi:tetratricopeptide (TPR) repeat protein